MFALENNNAAHSCVEMQLLYFSVVAGKKVKFEDDDLLTLFFHLTSCYCPTLRRMIGAFGGPPLLLPFAKD